MSPSRRIPCVVFAAFALAVLLPAAPARATADIFEKHTLQNSKVKIVLAKVRRNSSATDAILGVKQIEDLATGVRFKSIFSPVWSVELRSVTDPDNNPPIKVPPNPIDSVFLPLDDIEVIETTTSAFQMKWHHVPIPGQTSTLEVEVDITLRADLKSEWDVKAVVIGGGPYGIYAVRFPYLALDKISQDGTTDRLVTPFSGGMKLRQPLLNTNDFPEMDSLEGSVPDAFFTYPGQMFTQWMAYYDPLEVGLYMQAEDVGGNTKNLYFNSDNSFLRPDKRRFYFYFTHFNKTPSVGSGATPAERRRAFAMFGIKAKYNYAMVLDTFTGDWVNASQIYRDWVTTTGAPFISRGTLAARGDFNALIKATAYAFRYQLPLDPLEVDPQAEYDKVQRFLKFYDNVQNRFDPGRQHDLTPLVLSARTNYIEGIGPILASGDDVAEPIRPGVPEWLYDVKFPAPGDLRVRELALNRDTTGIATDGVNTPVAYTECVMRNSRFEPMIPETNLYRTCLGSPWLTDHRSDLVVQMIHDSRFNDTPGFTMAALSGDGNFSYECYAPGVDDPSQVDPVVHDHDVGGGNYLATGWHTLASNIRSKSQSQEGVSFVLLGMEHEPETMITDYVLNGRSFTEPYDDSAPGVHRTISNSLPVPLFKFQYHDYNIWPGKVQPFTSAVDLYVDATHSLGDLLLLRYRIAQLAMLGRLLIVQVSQEPDLVTYEGIPDDLPPELQDEHQLIAALAVLRSAIQEYMIYGRALRDPDVTPAPASDTVAMRTIWKGVETIDQIPRIVASGWADDNFHGYPGVILLNFTPQGGIVTFSISPSDYGLAPGQQYKIQRRSFQFDWTDTGMTLSGSDSVYVSPQIYVPPLEDLTDEPWRVYRIVPSP